MTAPRRVVVLRHGQTAYNIRDRIQGQTDVEIDETGHTQAAAVAPAIAALRPSLLWSSDLARTRQTVAYLAKETGLEPTYDARLREYALGEREELTHTEYRALAPEEFAQFKRGNFDVVPGGEPTVEVRARMLAALADLFALVEPGETAVAVSHGAAIRVAVAGLLGWPDGAEHTLGGLANCGWAELETHLPDGRIRLTAYNRTAPHRG